MMVNDGGVDLVNDDGRLMVNDGRLMVNDGGLDFVFLLP